MRGNKVHVKFGQQISELKLMRLPENVCFVSNRKGYRIAIRKPSRDDFDTQNSPSIEL